MPIAVKSRSPLYNSKINGFIDKGFPFKVKVSIWNSKNLCFSYYNHSGIYEGLSIDLALETSSQKIYWPRASKYCVIICALWNKNISHIPPAGVGNIACVTDNPEKGGMAMLLPYLTNREVNNKF